jgi:hypothetical protein
MGVRVPAWVYRIFRPRCSFFLGFMMVWNETSMLKILRSISKGKTYTKFEILKDMRMLMIQFAP